MNKYLLIALRSQVKDMSVSGLARLEAQTLTVNVQGLNIGGMGSTGCTAYIIHRDGKVAASPLARMPGGYSALMKTMGRINAVAVAGMWNGAPTMLLLGAPAGEYLDVVRIRTLVLGMYVVPKAEPKPMPMPEPMPESMPMPETKPMPRPIPEQVPAEEEIPMPSPQGMLGNFAASTAFCPECETRAKERGGSLAAQNSSLHQQSTTYDNEINYAATMGIKDDTKRYTYTKDKSGEDAYSSLNYSEGVYSPSRFDTIPAGSADDYNSDVYSANVYSDDGYNLDGYSNNYENAEVDRQEYDKGYNYDSPVFGNTAENYTATSPAVHTNYENGYASNSYETAGYIGDYDAGYADEDYDAFGEADEVIAHFNADKEEAFQDRTARMRENVYAEDDYDLPVQQMNRPQPFDPFDPFGRQPRPTPPPRPPRPTPTPPPPPPRPPFPPPRPPFGRPPTIPVPVPIPVPQPTPLPAKPHTSACVQIPRRFYQGVPTGRLIVNTFPIEYPGVDWLVYRFPTSGNYLRTRFRNPDVECFAIPALPSAYPPAGIPSGARYMMARNGRGYWVFCSC